MSKKIIFPILILALAAMACGFNIKAPKVELGPTVIENIKAPAPKTDEVSLNLSFGAGDLTLAPGSEENLVEGTAKYNYDKLKPEVKTESGAVTISMGKVSFNGLPSGELVNEWDLKLSDQPMALEISAGAYKGKYELGGLALTSLHISDGAANSQIIFSKPNQVKMTLFRYETGASSVKITNLANANFDSMFFSGGAGDYTLDFGGELKQDATVSVETGLGDVQLIIPKNVNVKITVEGAALNVTHSSGWMQNGSEYVQKGQGPLLTIVVEMAAGNLTITD